jgi:glyoxylate/hydroxypyruvate reductase A
MHTIPLIGQLSEAEQSEWQAALNKHLSHSTITPLSELSAEEQANAEVAVVANPDPQDLLRLPKLKWIQSLWAGVEKIIPLAKAQNLQLVRLVDPLLAESMAEAVLTACLMHHRHAFHYARAQRQQRWHPLPQLRASQKTVGILGLGELGRASAAVLVDSGFRVMGWSRKPKNFPGIECISGADGLTQILQASDMLVLLLPLTAKTHHLLSAREFSLLKPSGCVINFGRGGLIEEKALLTWLESNSRSQALLDVFDIEPLPKQHPFWGHEQITVWPHVSAPTNIDSASQIAANNLNRYLHSGELPLCVDLDTGY